MPRSTFCQQLFVFVLSGLLAAPLVQAQETAPRHDDTAGAPAAPMSTGEVLKVDRELGKITLRHGPLSNLNMPGMTMVFRVAEPAMLDQVKPGDKVQFVAEQAGGALTITALQGAN